MVTQTDADQFEIPVRCEDTVDIIRIAFFKNELSGAIAFAVELLQKGYEVFLQPMATFMYTPEELNGMLRKINRLLRYSINNSTGAFPAPRPIP